MIVNYLILQIGLYPGDEKATKAANPYCTNVDLPANGGCAYGWLYMPNDYAARPLSDPTVGIDCLGTYPYPI